MTIQITYGTVTSAADQISRDAKHITSELDALNAKVKKVVSTWDGEAQQAYNARHRGWDEAVKGLNQTLQLLSAKLHQAASGYQHTDRKAAQQFDF